MHKDLRELNESGVRGAFFRTQPAIVEAFQMTLERRTDNRDWPHWLHAAWQQDPYTTGAVFPFPGEEGCSDGRLMVTTESGNVVIELDDWIVRGPELELEAYEPGLFAEDFEPIAKTETMRDFVALAQLAYHAYGQTTDFKNYQGLPMPLWDELPPKIREAWLSAATCVSSLTKD